MLAKIDASLNVGWNEAKPTVEVEVQFPCMLHARSLFIAKTSDLALLDQTALSPEWKKYLAILLTGKLVAAIRVHEITPGETTVVLSVNVAFDEIATYLQRIKELARFYRAGEVDFEWQAMRGDDHLAILASRVYRFNRSAQPLILLPNDPSTIWQSDLTLLGIKFALEVCTIPGVTKIAFGNSWAQWQPWIYLTPDADATEVAVQVSLINWLLIGVCVRY